MFINIPIHIEQIIIKQAQEQGISVSQLITQTFAKPKVYPKGDIRRLKGIAKSDVKLSIDEMNKAIAMGAIYGERNDE